MSMEMECLNCGGTEVDADPARGDVVCTSCGSVVENHMIVSEVQFEETSSGAMRAVGQLVTDDGQVIGGGMVHGFLRGVGKDSRLVTINNARRRIQEVGHQMKLTPTGIDTAINFYKLALSRRLTQGRRSVLVIAACLYMACRIERTDHMLLDLSDILQVNVYVLGRMYLHISQELCIRIPAIDPSVYIPRFAHNLEFGGKTHEVCMTALRLLQRMKRDWIHTGRRPSGLCGAALLVAARLHNFNRSIKDIIKVVKVGESTIKKRLSEFTATPSSSLTLADFFSQDLPEEQDPPSFKAARKKELLQLEDPGKVEAAITEVHLQIEKALEQRKQQQQGSSNPYIRFLHFSPEEVDDEDGDDPPSHLTHNFVTEQTMKSISQLVQSGEDLQPTAATVGLKDSIQDCMKIYRSGDDPDSDGELDLTGIEDSELEMYLMSEDEVQQKTNLWSAVNADYIKSLQEKEERKKMEEKNAASTDPPKKRRRHLRKEAASQEAHSAGEAIEKMLHFKKISSKINYDVVRRLDGDLPAEESSSKRLRTSKPTPSFNEQALSQLKGLMHSIIQDRISTQQQACGSSEESESPGETQEEESCPGTPNPEEVVQVVTSDIEELSAQDLLRKHRGEVYDDDDPSYNEEEESSSED